MSKDAPADDPMLRPRYTGLASFMRAPYRDHDWSGVEIGMIGVPYDGWATGNSQSIQLDPAHQSGHGRVSL